MDEGGELLYIKSFFSWKYCLYYADDWQDIVSFKLKKNAVYLFKTVLHIAKKIITDSFVDVDTTDKV